jgi:PilZ domain-containing protein
MATIPQGRLFPRTQAVLPCRVTWHEDDVAGTAKNISYNGIAVSLPAAVPPQTQEPARISLQEPILLSVIPVHTRTDQEGCVIGFRVTKIEAGEQLWKEWNTVSRQ